MFRTRSVSIVALAAMPVLAQHAGAVKAMEGTIHAATHRDAAGGEHATDSIRRMARPAGTVRLRAPRADERQPVRRKPGLTPVGVSRQLPDDGMDQGEWSTTAEGKRVWRLAVESSGADGLRLRFREFRVGSGQVWLLGTGAAGREATAGPYTDRGPNGDGEFWSDFVPGDTVIVAYEPAPDETGGETPFVVASLSHRFARAESSSGGVKAAADPAAPAAAASCTVDVSCFPEYREPASAVALMIFESDGATYQCSGSLLHSGGQAAVPLFLTAHHCIGTEEEARSLITIFGYQTPICNGVAPALSSLPRVNGSTLLEGEPMELGDFTLLRLSAFPKVDVKVLGWTSEEIPANEQVTSISHPVGDYKRIALGQRTRDVTIRFDDGEQMPAAKGIQVAWFQGVTQGGSSGSPLLANRNGTEYVVGTLSAGPVVDEDNDRQVCRTRNMVASFGRFAAAFPYLERFLTASAAPAGGVAFSASPNPVVLTGSTGLGVVTLSWNAPGLERVQVRVNSPDGPAMTGLEPGAGSASTGEWVSDGMTFFLQDASSGDSPGSAKTLATVRVGLVRNFHQQSAAEGDTRASASLPTPTGPRTTEPARQAAWPCAMGTVLDVPFQYACVLHSSRASHPRGSHRSSPRSW